MKYLAIAALMTVSACGMPGQTEDPNEAFWGSYYSYSKSDEKKEEEWWDGFFGKTKPTEDAACSFYGTCKSAQ